MPRGGWDHAFLADIALHGRILHVPTVLFFRREGPAPLRQLARNASLAWSRARSADDLFGDLGALAPYTTCLWAHLETFALARLPDGQRAALIAQAREIRTVRCACAFDRERDALVAVLPRLVCQQDDGRAWGEIGAVFRQRNAVRLLIEVNAWATGDRSLAAALRRNATGGCMSAWFEATPLPSRPRDQERAHAQNLGRAPVLTPRPRRRPRPTRHRRRQAASPRTPFVVEYSKWSAWPGKTSG